MKKNLLVVIITLIVLSVSCKKNEIDTSAIQTGSEFVNFCGFNVKVQENNGKLGIKGGQWLYFEDRIDYEKAISVLSNSSNDKLLCDFENTLCFNSMRKNLAVEERESINIVDDVLATMLNTDGIIQIGKYVFDIDTKDEIAYVYNLEKESEPMIFDTNCSFFDYIDGNFDDFLSKDDDLLKSTYTFYGSTGNVDCKLTYQRAVVYFSLLAKIKEHVAGTGGSVDLYLSVSPGSYTKNRKNATQQHFGGTTYCGNENTYTYRPYSAACGLKQLHMVTTFGIIDYGGNYPISKYKTLSINKN